MKSSRLAGLGTGTAVVVALAIGSVVVAPPPAPEGIAPSGVDTTSISAPPIESDEALAAPLPEDVPEIEDLLTLPDDVADATPPAAEIVQAPAPTEPSARDTAPDETTEAPLPDEASAPAPVPDERPVGAVSLEDTAPDQPVAENRAEPSIVTSQLVAPRGDRAASLPQVSAPEPSTDAAEEEARDDDPAPVEARPAVPGTRPVTLPQIGVDSAISPAPADATQTALERNALYAGGAASARMAVILNDPGLPTALREALAGMDVPLTIALNPLDPTARAAADLYREGGKEVLILATSLPIGATASDLDVTFSTFFETLPSAVGVLDLPSNGFARNAALLREILPLLARDGHGLVTFGGGLAQSTRETAAAGIAHTEVFRILDSGDDSAFTIRRFLDRAVFQANQTGAAVVFGDAANEATRDAIEMWRDGLRNDQVAITPISGILLAGE